MVTRQNSYIFIKNPYKDNSPVENNEGTLVLEIGKNVYGFISQVFPVKLSDERTDLFKINCSGIIMNCDVHFVIHEVADLEYLNVSVEGKTISQTIKCLEQIQLDLLESGIRKYYIEIVSYDAISEYYCNKMVVKLNELERNLRKLMFNIYVLNFGKDYCSATIQGDLQDRIKQQIGSSIKNEKLNEIKSLYGVNKDQAKTIARLQQFFYSFTLSDIQELLFEPRWTSFDEEARDSFLANNKDLSALSDSELRNAFDKFTPHSDWDRFFSSKITIDNIRQMIDTIRGYRNSVAHFKHFDKDDYRCCNNLVKKLNKAVIEAIETTEDVDFVKKNAAVIKDLASSFVERFNEITKSFVSAFASQTSPALKSLVESFSMIKGENGSLIESDDNTATDDSDE